MNVSDYDGFKAMTTFSGAIICRNVALFCDRGIRKSICDRAVINKIHMRKVTTGAKVAAILW